MQRHPNVFATSISHTTRGPRPGEVPDEDYYFVSMADFEKLIDAGGFVEHAKFGGNRYGTSRKMIDDVRGTGKVVILDIEMEVYLHMANPGASAPSRRVGVPGPLVNRCVGRKADPGRQARCALRLHRAAHLRRPREAAPRPWHGEGGVDSEAPRAGEEGAGIRGDARCA